jgi:hypothetical protein
MSDISGAEAPAEVSAPVEVAEPNPVSTEPEGHVEPEKPVETKPEVKSEPVEKKPPTTREALQRAAEQVEKDEKAKVEKPEVKADPKAKVEAKPDVKPEVKTERQRDETGKFASDKPKEQPKPSHTAGDAPARFTKDVKDVWATLPDNVRGEVTRMERELTEGYAKHRQAAERDAGLAEYHEMAQKGGTTVKEALANYVGMENMIRQDPIRGLERVCQNMGLSLRDVAAHVLNQKPEEVAGQQDATIRELKAELADLKKQVGGVTQTFQQQQEQTVGKQVSDFASDPAHSRFDELHEDIAFFLKNRCPGDLEQAYKLAERLNPAPVTEQPAASSAPVIDLAAQTARGSKSINGAPSAGSSPAASKPSTSIKESLRRAMAAAG